MLLVECLLWLLYSVNAVLSSEAPKASPDMNLQKLLSLPTSSYYDSNDSKDYRPVFNFYKDELCRAEQFTLIQELSKNEHGDTSVYLANYRGEKVVVKKYYSPKNKIQVEKVRMEELALHKFDHPNITKGICTFKDSEGNIHLAMKYSSENTLLDVLKSKEADDLKNQRKIARQMVDVLIYLHSLKIIHNDIKPENIIVDENWSIKLIDFEMAAYRPNGYCTLFRGTPGFMAPEKFRLNEKYNNGVDWYAFGVTLYELIYKKNPFEGSEDLADLAKAVLRGMPKLKDTDADDFISNICKPGKAQRWCSANRNNQDILNHPFIKDLSLENEFKALKISSGAWISHEHARFFRWDSTKVTRSSVDQKVEKIGFGALTRIE